MQCLKVIAVVICVFAKCSSPASILAVIPTLSMSHFAVFDPLLVQLIDRGHELLLVSGYSLRTRKNYTHINIKEAKENFNGSWSLNTLPQIPTNYRNILRITKEQVKENENILKLKSIKSLIDSNLNFDLFIVEQFISDAFLAFASKFDTPFITISTCPCMPWALDRYGVPLNLAFSPNLFSGYTSNMTFIQRCINTIQVFYAKLYNALVLEKISLKMAKTSFGDSTLDFNKISKTASLFLVNSHFTFFSPQPLPPQVVEVGGIHVKSSNPLNQELDQWMNESPLGVVYFSFGSMLRGATLPADKVKSFLQVFATLKQRVLWKWEDDTVDNLPSNVKIMKWLPQRDILGHPKTRVFISHGGLLGTTEAVVSGVPILGIPMYGDQPNNVAALVENRVAIHIDYNNISVESLSYALNTLLNDNSYTENAKQLSRRFLDRPMSPLDTAVYWTEYVIRHKGAPHLRSAAVDMPWYQYYLLDVIAFCLTVLMSAIFVIYYTLRSALRIIVPTKTTKFKSS